MKKRVLSLILACTMVFSILCVSAAAAEPSADTGASSGVADPNYIYNGYFTGGTGILNTIAGNMSKIDPISSGSLPATAKVTSVELSVSVSKGSTDFYLVVVSPEGNVVKTYVLGSYTNTVLRKITLDDFNGEDPYGTWYIYIYNTGTSFLDVATATVNMIGWYGYNSYA